MSGPIAVEEDELGRVVAATLQSEKPPAGVVTRWLVAVDGSAHSMRGLAHAVKMGLAFKGLGIDLVFVSGWKSKEASRDLPEEALRETAAARELLDASKLPWRLFARMGEPAEAILDCARGEGVDAIVIGSHGRGAVAAMVMGSVALEVLKGSSVPVWVVR